MNIGQLECPLKEALAEALSLTLEEEALSSSWYEVTPEYWVFQVLFKAGQETLIRQKIAGFFEDKGVPLPRLTKTTVEEKNWVASVYRDFPPLTIGQFYIYGAHIQAHPPENLIPLQIEAATAFGSGQHESTEGCLKALSLLAKDQSFIRPLDMGCGSGILAIGMAALWKVPVLACDNDLEAVKVTQENAQKNGVHPWLQAEVSEGFAELRGKTFDLITANILAGPLCQMVEDVNQALMPGGVVILAGLLNRQAEEVITTYERVGLHLVHQLLVGEWSTLMLRKDNHG